MPADLQARSAALTSFAWADTFPKSSVRVAAKSSLWHEWMSMFRQPASTEFWTSSRQNASRQSE